MTDEQTVANAVAQWAGTVCSIPPERRYAWPVDLKAQLPDVAAVVQRARIARDDPAFPFSQLQGAWLLIFEMEVSVMVEKSDTDGDSKAVQEALEGYGKSLREAAVADATLEGRVQFTSPMIECDYSAPPVIDEGGIKGRVVFVSLSVGELVDEPA